MGKETDGYCGADIEAIVRATVKQAFLVQKEIITTGDLLVVAKSTKSLTVTLKDKIDFLREQMKKTILLQRVNGQPIWTEKPL